ncbi:MAG: hypothetical protein JWO13_291 [Acidobacteriales bacterium]|nr:hypothetical protein [Terriglobales bacterium]
MTMPQDLCSLFFEIKSASVSTHNIPGERCKRDEGALSLCNRFALNKYCHPERSA